jgi:hypothetical protein
MIQTDPTHERNKKEWSLADRVDELLADKTIQHLPEVEQGVIIMDQFIGALIRKGDLQGSQRSYSPVDALRTMHQAAKDMAKQTPSPELIVTSVGGLREAMLKLFDDPRTGEIASVSPESLLIKDEDGSPLLGSINQIEGYLQADDDANRSVGGPSQGAETWLPLVRQEVDSVIYNGSTWNYNPSKGSIESDNDTLRKAGIEWHQASGKAKEAGVNLKLIGRSAERLATRRTQGSQLATTALYLEISTIGRGMASAASDRSFKRLFERED